MRYTLLRILLFFGVLIVCWFLGLRGWPLLLIAAVASSIVSLVALRGPREQFAAQIEQRVADKRLKADQHRTLEDEDE
ncbi:DUF4229 domain-containing protein [Calidifontibacter sp. DB0510]|uniref:DUF4229 domain-containing protein n=1 Tax=Metallococcus carri TaxID=1656884 RepID=A0A967EGN5_9MICO|nr:DUF4229 domain-containing protein [Metallococcus carri]NHN55308.1 DUF4229 domain-containing protein [Metallococcus carri]NOP36385.1 DUF4229 domain-containing protein [Calidifontibacter sp. DB2511S]